MCIFKIVGYIKKCVGALCFRYYLKGNHEHRLMD